jgi:hypothetical protein
MEPPRFNKLTREVGLVLISSSLILGGCYSHRDEEKEDGQAGPAGPPAASGGHSYGGHGGYVPVRIAGRSAVTSGGSQRGGSAQTSGSVRGGFGATGHAATAGT